MKIITNIKDFGFLRATALAAATIISFEAESKLAAMAGVTVAVSYAMPVAIDCLMIAALRSRRVSAVACAAVLMGAANAGSHLLSPETSGIHRGIIAAVSVIPVVVLMLLELLVPAVSEKRSADAVRPTVPHPVSWLSAETLADVLTVPPVVPEVVPAPEPETDETLDVPPTVPEPAAETEPETEETPAPVERMSKDAALSTALHGYVNGETVRAIETATGWSRSTVGRWYAQWEAEGVARLVNA